MNTLSWLKTRFSSRGKALLLYRRGMARAKRHNHPGAIGDYTAAIDMLDAPSDVKAMARYNRALVHVATGDYRLGLDDLDALLADDEAPANVKRMARQKLAKRARRSDKSNM